MSGPIPHIGAWYQDLTTQAVFEVVAIDSQEQTVEIQLLDGEIAEYDIESWGQLVLVSVNEPEDWLSTIDSGYDGIMDPDSTYYPDMPYDAIDQLEPTEMLGSWED
ncbi:MAG: DUF6763 family protein [Pseudomonadales bacterium]